VAVVVDTDVVSFLYKQDDRGAFYHPYLANQLPIISFMTLAELERWTLAANWGELKRQHLNEVFAKIHRVSSFSSAVSEMG
jgi:tRNA(fMet)-specific endonuclease VapC